MAKGKLVLGYTVLYKLLSYKLLGIDRHIFNDHLKEDSMEYLLYCNQRVL